MKSWKSKDKIVMTKAEIQKTALDYLSTNEREDLPSASGANEWVRCNAQFLFAKDAKRKDTQFSESGTRVHEALRIWDFTTLTDNERWMADRILEKRDWLLDFHKMRDAERVIEERFWRSDEEFKHLYSAKPDVVYIKDEVALIINYKTGWYLPVDINQNWQMRCEAVCVGSTYNIKTAHVVLLHPNVWPYMQYATYEYRDLMLYRDTLDKAAIAALSPSANFTYGPIQCAWCTMAEVCTTNRKSLELITPQREKMIEVMTPDERGTFLTMLDSVEKLAKRVKDKAKDMLEIDPDCISNWYVSPGNTEQFVTDEMMEKFFTKLDMLYPGINKGQYASVSLPEVRKIVAKRAQIKQDEAKELINEQFKDCIGFSTKKGSLKQKLKVPKEIKDVEV